MSDTTDEPATRGDGLPDDDAARGDHGDPDDHGDDGDLDGRLAGALERVGHATRTMLTRAAYAQGVSALQLQLLLRLGSSSSGPRVSDLAVELDVSQATVSDALSTLRRKNLVTKGQDPTDRRSAVFSLTSEGEQVRRGLARWDDPVTAGLAAFTRTDKGTTLDLVLRLIAELHAGGVINVARTCMTCRYFEESANPEDARPYRCNLLDVAFTSTGLRVDCLEHEAGVRGG